MTRRMSILLLAVLLSPAAWAGQDNPFEAPESLLQHLPRQPAAALPPVPVESAPVRQPLADGDVARLHVIAITADRAVLTLGQEPDKRLLSVTAGQTLYFKGHKLKVVIDGLNVQLLEGRDVVYAADLDESQDQDHMATTNGTGGTVSSNNGQR